MNRNVRRLLRRIDPAEVKAELDAALVPVTGLEVPGQVLLAPGELFVAQIVRDRIEELAYEGRFTEKEREELEEVWWTDLIEYLAGGELRWEVSCSNPGSMVSGEWGMRSFTLGDRGYFVEETDPDFTAERPYALLGAWEPKDSKETYGAAFVETYVYWWQDIGLPPFQGGSADGPSELIGRALDRIGISWRLELRYKLEDSYQPQELIESLLEPVGKETGLPPETVARVLRELLGGEPAGDVPPEEQERIYRAAYLDLW